jgi:hypothetical protein
MAAEEYICLNIECRYHSAQPFPVCPKCGHANTFVTKNEMRVRGCIGGALFVAIGCFVLLIGVFASVLIASQRTAISEITAKDVAALILLYGIGSAFVIGGISIMTGGGRWFIRSIIAFATRGRRSK